MHDTCSWISTIKETKHDIVVFCQYFGCTRTTGILAAACVYIYIYIIYNEVYYKLCVHACNYTVTLSWARYTNSNKPFRDTFRGLLKLPEIFPQVTAWILNVHKSLSPFSCTPWQMIDVVLVLDGQLPQPKEDIVYETAEQFGATLFHSKVSPSVLTLVRFIWLGGMKGIKSVIHTRV